MYSKNFAPEASMIFELIDKELMKIPNEKVRGIAKDKIENIKNSNRRDFRF